MTPSETIGGYAVHPAASLFPLLEGDEFDSLVKAIRDHGVRQPVVIHDNVLVDGRNRVRAVERLKAEGINLDLPTVILQLRDDQTVADWVYDTNLVRRHLTEDARALVAARMVRLIEAENAQRQKATQFTSETAAAAAQSRHAADTKTHPPQKRDTKTKNARSTTGRIAAKAKTSHHKGRQAARLVKEVEAGTVPPEEEFFVMNGTKRLKDVVPSKPSSPKKEKTADGDPLVAEFDERWPKAWKNFIKHFPVVELPAVRKLVINAVRKETASQG